MQPHIPYDPDKKLPAEYPADSTPELPLPPPVPDALPIRSWEQFVRTGSIDDYLTYRTLEGGGYASQGPWDRSGTDAVRFPGQNTDPAHF